MKTKLRRIEELMRKKRNNSTEQVVPEEVQAQLQDEIDKLTSENSHIKDRNKKLRAIEKELSV